MAGRKPKPTALKKLEGNPGKRKLNTKEPPFLTMSSITTWAMLSGIEGVMNLAAASGEDLATTSDIVTDALTAFGLSAQDSGHFADILAAASSNANTNVSMMGETFKYCAPIAGALGFSVEDTAEAIGLMANAGIKGSQVGTSLRTIMNNLSGDVKICGSSIGEVTVATTNVDGSIRNGYLYVLGYDNDGVYKINIANPTDITFLSFGFTSEVKSICTSGSCEVRLMMIGDVIIGYDFIIDVSDRVEQTIGGTRMSNNLATPLFQYKEFLVGWGGSYGNEYRYNFLFTPYLATICNLSQAVVKNADKTMKITYTLTEQVVSS